MATSTNINRLTVKDSALSKRFHQFVAKVDKTGNDVQSRNLFCTVPKDSIDSEDSIPQTMLGSELIATFCVQSDGTPWEPTDIADLAIEPDTEYAQVYVKTYEDGGFGITFAHPEDMNGSRSNPQAVASGFAKAKARLASA